MDRRGVGGRSLLCPPAEAGKEDLHVGVHCHAGAGNGACSLALKVKQPQWPCEPGGLLTHNILASYAVCVPDAPTSLYLISYMQFVYLREAFTPSLDDDIAVLTKASNFKCALAGHVLGFLEAFVMSTCAPTSCGHCRPSGWMGNSTSTMLSLLHGARN